ncbi:heme NO-binding domain-containing protein [Pararhodobacter marinus]|uniref:Heme NO-binding protein n=1 Tax=Pararhodobacter marinus TaxID=2184063 RepID=A0A2U2CA08_9RHOB|nr:heme NO-binding domain-containing protein [Pararhodobacter marinus]PWE28707.1 heme NO-binding protein [Pararhodobacter marinus]
MHGLINKALQTFLCDSFGRATWDDVLARAGLRHRLDPDGFEAMNIYDDRWTQEILAAAGETLRRPQESLLEDLGTYLVSSERMENLRRLLRFGGVTFTDFLYSLDELQGRSALAVPDLDMPVLSISCTAEDSFALTCGPGWPGLGHVMLGVLRAMADDYGVLAVLDHCDTQGCTCPTGDRTCFEIITIRVHDPAHQAARQFDLATELL